MNSTVERDIDVLAVLANLRHVENLAGSSNIRANDLRMELPKWVAKRLAQYLKAKGMWLGSTEPQEPAWIHGMDATFVDLPYPILCSVISSRNAVWQLVQLPHGGIEIVHNLEGGESK